MSWLERNYTCSFLRCSNRLLPIGFSSIMELVMCIALTRPGAKVRVVDKQKQWSVQPRTLGVNFGALPEHSYHVAVEAWLDLSLPTSTTGLPGASLPS